MSRMSTALFRCTYFAIFFLTSCAARNVSISPTLSKPFESVYLNDTTFIAPCGSSGSLTISQVNCSYDRQTGILFFSGRAIDAETDDPLPATQIILGPVKSEFRSQFRVSADSAGFFLFETRFSRENTIVIAAPGYVLVECSFNIE